MDLEIPPDPKDVDKNWLENLRQSSTDGKIPIDDEISREKKKSILKQGTPLASYFWTKNNWKEKLGDEMKWHQFVKCCRDNYGIFLKWWEREKNWESSVEEFIDRLERYI